MKKFVLQPDQQTETGPVVYNTALGFTMSWMTFPPESRQIFICMVIVCLAKNTTTPMIRLCFTSSN